MSQEQLTKRQKEIIRQVEKRKRLERKNMSDAQLAILDKYQKPVGHAEGMARAAAQGLSLGWGDEVEARIRSMGPDTYQQAADRVRERMARYQRANPGKTLGAEIGGTLPVLFLPGARRGAAASLLARTGMAATSGAAGGGVYAAGLSEKPIQDWDWGDAGNLLGASALGAGMGVGATGLLTAGGWAGGRVADAIRNKVQGRKAPERGHKAMRNWMEMTGQDTDEVIDMASQSGSILDEFTGKPTGPAARQLLIENPDAKTLGRRAAQVPGARKTIKEGLDAREEHLTDATRSAIANEFDLVIPGEGELRHLIGDRAFTDITGRSVGDGLEGLSEHTKNALWDEFKKVDINKLYRAAKDDTTPWPEYLLEDMEDVIEAYPSVLRQMNRELRAAGRKKFAALVTVDDEAGNRTIEWKFNDNLRGVDAERFLQKMKELKDAEIRDPRGSNSLAIDVIGPEIKRLEDVFDDIFPFNKIARRAATERAAFDEGVTLGKKALGSPDPGGWLTDFNDSMRNRGGPHSMLGLTMRQGTRTGVALNLENRLGGPMRMGTLRQLADQDSPASAVVQEVANIPGSGERISQKASSLVGAIDAKKGILGPIKGEVDLSPIEKYTGGSMAGMWPLYNVMRGDTGALLPLLVSQSGRFGALAGLKQKHWEQIAEVLTSSDRKVLEKALKGDREAERKFTRMALDIVKAGSPVTSTNMNIQAGGLLAPQETE